MRRSRLEVAFPLPFGQIINLPLILLHNAILKNCIWKMLLGQSSRLISLFRRPLSWILSNPLLRIKRFQVLIFLHFLTDEVKLIDLIVGSVLCISPARFEPSFMTQSPILWRFLQPNLRIFLMNSFTSRRSDRLQNILNFAQFAFSMLRLWRWSFIFGRAWKVQIRRILMIPITDCLVLDPRVVCWMSYGVELVPRDLLLALGSFFWMVGLLRLG